MTTLFANYKTARLFAYYEMTTLFANYKTARLLSINEIALFWQNLGYFVVNSK
jgi:hypothetical protein